MRILIVSQYFWPESFVINDLALALRQRGHDVTVLTGLPNYPSGAVADGYGFRGPWAEALDGVDILRVPLVPRGSSKGARLAVNYASFAASGTVLGAPRVRGDVDVIFVFEVSPITAALPAIALRRWRRVPVALWVQDIWPDVLEATGATRSRAVVNSMGALTRWIYARCDRILAASRAFIPRIARLDVPVEKITYVPNWADPFYQPVEVELDAPERGELPHGFRILYGGNIGESQAFPTILDAAEKLLAHEDIHWIVVGDGRHRPWVEHEVARRRLGRAVHLLGPRPPRAMPSYYALADALLVSLTRAPLYTCTVPSKLQPYLASGRPIVAALDGEGAEIVREAGAGVVAGAENAAQLAQAVLDLSRMSPGDRQAMGARGRSYFEAHFERDLVIDRLESILLETAKSAR